MALLIICTFILIYGLIQYLNGQKGRGALVFFFFLTGGFHFLNQSWCPVKYTDFAVVYLLVVALLNVKEDNYAFFEPQIKIYKVATIIGLYITLEFIRTLVLKEELLSFALANYRTYIPFFSFWLVQELEEREVNRLFKQIAFVTILSTVVFDFQPLFNIKVLQHANVGEHVNESGLARYRNIPYLAYFFIFLATIKLNFNKLTSIALVSVFLMALILTQHRAVMMAYIFCVCLFLLITKKQGKFIQYGIIGLFFFLFAGEAIMSRFEKKINDTSTIDDIKAVMNLDYESAVNNEFENENGTLSFRVLLLMERVEYILSHPRYIVFGIGTRHEDSPRTLQQFYFKLGSHRASNDSFGQISSGDLAWVDPLLRFGFLGIALLLYFSWLTIAFFYRNRKISDVVMASFLFYLLLIIISFKNDHLYRNMQLFFIYLLIEYVRCSYVDYKNYS